MSTTQQSEKWVLRLYVAGQSPRSMAALTNLKRLCDQHLAGQYQIEVIDLMKNPRLAKDHEVTPFQPWCARYLYHCVGWSAIFPTASGRWWGFSFGRNADRRAGGRYAATPLPI